MRTTSFATHHSVMGTPLLLLTFLSSLHTGFSSYDAAPISTATISSVMARQTVPLSHCRYKDRSYRPVGFLCYMCVVSILQKRNAYPPIEINRQHNRSILQQACAGHSRTDCLENIDACCHAAERCCERQYRLQATLGERYKEMCPVTWDDISCINATMPSQEARVPCPAYIFNFHPNEHAVNRYCQANATWVLSTVRNYSWEKTDYMPCSRTARVENKLMAVLRLVLSCISLFLIGVSLVLFLGIRTLRAEKRIQLLANLFASLFAQYTVQSFISAADIQQHTIMEGGDKTDGIYEKMALCPIVGVANRFFTSATYAWYVCQAIFLYRQLNSAFVNIKSLKLFYLAGWGIPIVVNTFYCIVRVFFPEFEEKSISPSRCWLNDLQHFELIHRGPIILGLLINTVFLIYILYVVCNLHEVQGDNRTHKRSLKAALFLAPLFGLNFIFVMVHWENTIYKTIHALMAGSQGGVVAIIFCFLNHEVRTAFEAMVRRHCNRGLLSHRSSSTRGGSTQYTAVSHSRSRGRSNGSVMSNASHKDSLPLSSYRSPRSPNSTAGATVFQKL